ncbi:MAG: type II secretion system F family protein [Candidatus Omnitrophica bacterium]|nr:type II secretion system F family protein [Candidatus Omnitrophota bacterium]
MLKMPKFHYTAKRGPQDVIEGILEAENRSGVLAYLTHAGYVPVRIREHADGQTVSVKRPATPLRPRRVPSSALAMMTRQFASLTRSAVPLLRALSILEDQARVPYLKHVLRALSEEVRQGQTLSSAMAKFPTVFSPLYANLVRSGEISGALDAVLERLAEQAEQEEAIRMKLRMAFTYPAFVGAVGCGTVIFLMTFVMPRLSRLLIGLGSRLPAATRGLLAISEVMSTWWCWASVAAAVMLGIVLWRNLGERSRLAIDGLLLKVPLLGPLIQQIDVARFARSFGLQLGHGISILQAMDVALWVVGNRMIRKEFQRLPEALRQGTPLSSALKELSVGTAFLVNTVAVGEEVGNVGESLTEIARYYEQDSERLLQMMAALVEPILIVGVGLIVGFIVMAVLLPIFEMSTINP